ncbi:MAG TPA: tetratricopeptide repeat protein, partial [Phototrophicaceae bacterium]|nr:tetratricopeptide repeat protein [Phototrophicaceae bacterium]
MSEISLKEYFAKLNSLLSSNSADEVIHHCRHILQYFPKNVTAYRYLGRALVMNGRWEEGREALRRVLSVIPDDYFAHLGLSEANERMNRPDEAIWHLERAFEQRPNDKDLIDALRGLYRQYRHVDNLKVQLTSASVARQYLRSGAYTQAIDSLRSALTRMSERLDLKLLLAQILWQNGSEEEAAEIALEVLKVLPDCLEANKIMAQLWLSVGRPSDAQRFVNHLEGVDPYLAVELVQGNPPEDDVFQLEELDYVRTAQSELTSARPDWLTEISSGTPTQPSEPAQSDSRNAPPKVEEPEWTNWASAMLNKSAPKTDKLSNNNVPTTERFAAIRKEEEPVRTGGLTDLFGKVDEANSDELSALFEAGEAEEVDPMAWLRESGIEIVEDEEASQPTFDNLFGDDGDNPLPQQEEDPMAWLQNSNDDLILDNGNSVNASLGQEEDSMAWLRDSAPDEFVDDQSEAVASDDDSFGWLSDDHALDEALGLESLADGRSDAEPQTWDQAAFARDEQEEPAPTPVEQGIPGARRGLTAMLQDTSFDWSKNEQDDALVDDDEMDDWLRQFGPAEPNKAKAVTDTPDWLTALDGAETGVTEKDEWFAPDEAEPAEEFDLGSVQTLDSPDDEDSDWLAEFTPETSTPDDEFAWSKAAPAAEPEAQSSDVPDWLSSVEPDADEQPEKSELPIDDDFTWMNDGEPSSESEPQADAESDAAADMPDWLSSLNPLPSDEEAEPEAPSAVGADDEFAWMSEDALSQAETE